MAEDKGIRVEVGDRGRGRFRVGISVRAAAINLGGSHHDVHSSAVIDAIDLPRGCQVE